MKATHLLPMLGVALAAHGATNQLAQPSDAGPANSVDLTQLSLEQLLNIQVTSVSKREQPLLEAPSAISILTGEDIQRLGVTRITDALRLVPGVNVAQIDGHTWAVSARGFNDQFANKLLVLIDGRSVYTPLFSGTFWDVQDTLLEDVDRIEVIRGPGATVWGANAVNGVINIITKSAKDTQGGLVGAGGGSQEVGFGQVRYGGQLGEDAYYRIYSKYQNHADTKLLMGGNADDAWDIWQGGFRGDWERTDRQRLTFQGDAHYGSLDQTYFLPAFNTTGVLENSGRVEVKGGNTLARWTQIFSDDANLELQAYYDLTHRKSAIIHEERHTFDLELKNQWALGERHQFVWGLGYRLSSDEQNRNNFTLSFDPDDRTTHLYSAFAQDEISLVHDRLKLTLGTKYEHNDYTGSELQPGARLAWTPNHHNSLWGAVSRAVRTPSRAESDVRIVTSVVPGFVPTALTIEGNPGMESEDQTAYEIGYRIQPHRKVTVDLAAFYNDYDNLLSIEPGAPGPAFSPVFHAVVPLSADNNLYGETYGAEATVQYQPTEWWRLRASYAYLQMQLHTRHSSTDVGSEDAEGSSPHNQFTLHSSVDLPGNVFLDAIVRYVDTLPAQGIPSYVGLDLRLAWRPQPNLELSIVGQNLLDPQHPEWIPSTINTQTTEVPRAIYGKISWKF